MLSDRTAASAPEMPELKATPDGQNVVLTWNEPDNNGSAITSYQIQRFPSIDATGDVVNVWGDDAVDPTTEEGNDLEVGGDNKVIVPMPKGVTTHTDRGLQPGTTYFYRIRAVNACNDAASDRRYPVWWHRQSCPNKCHYTVVVRGSGDYRSPGSE